MAKKIIGIHGLANKPKDTILEKWWLDAINEGLGYVNSPAQVQPENFELLYWANVMYVKPQSEDKPAPFHLGQTYAKATKPPKKYKAGVLDWARETASDAVDNVLDDLGFLDKIADAILALKLKDLAVYWDHARAFDGGKTAKEVLCSKVKGILEANQDHQLMVIAHSMGSIIAFDTLTDNSSLKVDTFVTIGSPLGLPRVKRRAARGAKKDWPVVPPNIGKWINFADRRDPVAVDTSLEKDFLTKSGEPFIQDDLVANDYEYKDTDGKMKANPHKSYGYLRCPEVSETIQSFLTI